MAAILDFAVKFQINSVFWDGCRMICRKGGENEWPVVQSFHSFLVQGRFFGRCRKIAVSSVDGNRRLLAIFMSIMTKKVSLDDHYSHKPHVHILYDGLQRMAALLN